MIGWRTFAPCRQRFGHRLGTARDRTQQILAEVLGCEQNVDQLSACFWRLSNCELDLLLAFLLSCACFSSSWSCAWLFRVQILLRLRRQDGRLPRSLLSISARLRCRQLDARSSRIW